MLYARSGEPPSAGTFHESRTDPEAAAADSVGASGAAPVTGAASVTWKPCARCAFELVASPSKTTFITCEPSATVAGHEMGAQPLASVVSVPTSVPSTTIET